MPRYSKKLADSENICVWPMKKDLKLFKLTSSRIPIFWTIMIITLLYDTFMVIVEWLLVEYKQYSVKPMNIHFCLQKNNLGKFLLFWVFIKVHVLGHIWSLFKVNLLIFLVFLIMLHFFVFLGKLTNVWGVGFEEWFCFRRLLPHLKELSTYFLIYHFS